MGVDIDFENEQSNTYRYDVERIKRTLRIRANNPVYWYEVRSMSLNQSIWPHMTYFLSLFGGLRQRAEESKG